MILSVTSDLKHSAKCFPIFCRGDLLRTPRSGWGHKNRLNKIFCWRLWVRQSTHHFLEGPQNQNHSCSSFHQFLFTNRTFFGGKIGLEFYYLGNVFSTWPFAAMYSSAKDIWISSCSSNDAPHASWAEWSNEIEPPLFLNKLWCTNSISVPSPRSSFGKFYEL